MSTPPTPPYIEFNTTQTKVPLTFKTSNIHNIIAMAFKHHKRIYIKKLTYHQDIEKGKQQ